MSTLYRVENPNTNIGLWYNGVGEHTAFIRTLDDAQCRDLPMPFDPAMKDGGDWISACDNLPDMRHWFSVSDLRQLEALGYGLYEFDVPTYRTANGHAIFLREHVTATRRVPISLLDPTQQEAA